MVIMFSCRNCVFGQYSINWKTIFCSKKSIRCVIDPENANFCKFYEKQVYKENENIYNLEKVEGNNA